ncbi:MAG: hypothetical protein WKF43_04455 [Acidimicrobiales bacterium]
MLELAGYGWCEFLRPVNGLYGQDAEGINALSWELARADNINIVVASTTQEGVERIRPGTRPLAAARRGWQFVEGFHSAEQRPDGGRFRWCGPRGMVRAGGTGRHAFRINTVGLTRRAGQTIFAVTDGALIDQVTLTAKRPTAEVVVPARAGQLVELQSDRVFSPCWSGGSDSRVLSFSVDAPT